jgi:DNA-binding MarR family transcriptional regulator
MQDLRLLTLVERIGGLLQAERRRFGAPRGLRPVHFDILNYLARCNRYSDTPVAVADYLGNTKGTASQSLLVLERAGLIVKRPDPNDRRVARLELTEAGRSLCGESAVSALWESACQALSEEERAAAEAALEKLLREAQKANRTRTFGQCRGCRHLLVEGTERFRCGLTGEPLQAAETLQICREHEEPNT